MLVLGGCQLICGGQAVQPASAAQALLEDYNDFVEAIADQAIPDQPLGSNEEIGPRIFQQPEPREPEVATRPVFRVLRGGTPFFWEAVVEQRPDGTWEILHVDTGLPPAPNPETPSKRGRRRYRSGSGDRSLARGTLMLQRR